jgi:hypothetical protein
VGSPNSEVSGSRLRARWVLVRGRRGARHGPTPCAGAVGCDIKQLSRVEIGLSDDRQQIQPANATGRSRRQLAKHPRPRSSQDAVAGRAGAMKRKIAPCGRLGLAHNRPLCASIIERQTESPRPKPPDFVV